MKPWYKSFSNWSVLALLVAAVLDKAMELNLFPDGSGYAVVAAFVANILKRMSNENVAAREEKLAATALKIAALKVKDPQ